MDSYKTIQKIKKVFSKYHEVDVIEASPDAFNKLKRGNYDLVFNFSEGIRGEHRELYFPAILEMLNIPFTGSNALTMGITFNKLLTKKLLIYQGIATPQFFIIKSLHDPAILQCALKFPWIIKPVHEGSSIGIDEGKIVNDVKDAEREIKETLTKYQQDVLVEEYISGREFTVGVLGNNSLEILPIVEIKPKLEDQNTNWIWDKSEASENYLECPELPRDFEEKVKDTAAKTYRALDCKDWARIDFRADKDERLYVIEVNGIAGLSERSALPFAAEKSGFGFEGLLNKILHHALERYKQAGRNVYTIQD